MALPILDGNQSATTLSTIVTGGQHIPAHTVVSLGSQAITDMRSAVSGSVVSISNFPASQTIAGTVTANLDSNNFNGALTSYVEAVSSHNAFPVEIQYQPSVTIGSLPAISGTVTANIFSNIGDASVYLANPDNDTLVGASNPLPVAGSVSLGNISPDGGQTFKNFLSVKVESDYYQVGLDRIVPEVSVTNLVNTGSLTSRSGTPTTANSVFATTCVTNGQRKYLLIQNVTTGGNVITVGVGLSPTTTRGIQLVAGAGITFESSFIPTGAVYVLSSVTASNFTILEGQ